MRYRLPTRDDTSTMIEPPGEIGDHDPARVDLAWRLARIHVEAWRLATGDFDVEIIVRLVARSGVVFAEVSRLRDDGPPVPMARIDA